MTAPAGGGRPVTRVAAGILVTRILGYVRERVFAHYFGNTAAADAFRAALRVPNLVRNLLGEGTLSASFIPVYATLSGRSDRAAARALAGGVLGLLLLGAGVLAVAGIALAPTLAALVAPGFDSQAHALTVALLRILFPMAGLMVVSAWCLGVLNTHGRFFLPYAAPALWNVAAIAALLVAATWIVDGRGGMTPVPLELRLHRLALALAWGTVAGSVLQVAIQLPARPPLGDPTRGAPKSGLVPTPTIVYDGRDRTRVIRSGPRQEPQGGNGRWTAGLEPAGVPPKVDPK